MRSYSRIILNFQQRSYNPCLQQCGKRRLDNWTQGVIIKNPKKGATNDCNNWRYITSWSTPCNILAKIIIQRISSAVDQQLRKEQAGFRKGRGLRIIVEKCTDWQRYINFTDFQKAFNSIQKERACGAYFEPMVSLRRLSNISKASTNHSKVMTRNTSHPQPIKTDGKDLPMT